MIAASASSWCILRTSGGRTLSLARSLADAGFEVWTPTETASRLVWRGRSQVKRDIEGAILPTFVFARAHQYAALSALACDPVSRHPAFSMFRHAGRAPIIGDAAISGVRDIEESRAADRKAAIEAAREAATVAAEKAERAAMLKTEAARRKALRQVRRDFPVGAAVTVQGVPAFAGISGEIVESSGTSALVFFGGSLTVKVEAWQLIDDAVETRATRTA